MKAKIIKALIIMAIAIFVVGAVYYGTTLATAKVQPMNTVPVNGYFIDVNGDGLLDYVVSSDVIINKGGVNLPASP